MLLPNTVFVSQTGHIETWRAFRVPGKEYECVMYLDFYTPDPLETDTAKRRWARTVAERLAV